MLQFVLGPPTILLDYNYKNLDEFEFRRNSTADFGVSCPRASEISNNKLVSTPAPSFLIGSSSFLQVTRTTITAWMSSNFGRIPPLTSELVALEHLKKKRHIILLAL